MISGPVHRVVERLNVPGHKRDILQPWTRGSLPCFHRRPYGLAAAPTEHDLRLQNYASGVVDGLGEADGTASVSGVADGLGEADGTASVSGVADGLGEADGTASVSGVADGLGVADGTASVSGVADGLGEADGTASVLGVVSGEAETAGVGEGATGTGVALGNPESGARGLGITALLGTWLGAGVGDGFAKMS
jgi:hypothetical protein